jgi:hypothetical protein
MQLRPANAERIVDVLIRTCSVSRNPDKRSSRCVPPQRKCGKPVAEIDDATDIAVRALPTGMLRDVILEAVDVPLGQRPAPKGLEDSAQGSTLGIIKIDGSP